MSEAEWLASKTRERLDEHKEDLLASLRKWPTIRSLDEDLAWRCIENQVQCWFEDPAFARIIESSKTRRERADELYNAAKRTRTLLASVLRKNNIRFRSETGGELIEAWRRDNPYAAEPPDPPIYRACFGWIEKSREEQEHEYGFCALRQLAESLEKLEAAAKFVKELHPPRPEGRQKGSGKLPQGHIEQLGWLYSLLTGRDWSEKESMFVDFVQIVGCMIGLHKNYDVSEAIKRARPDYVPPPSRLRPRKPRA